MTFMRTVVDLNNQTLKLLQTKEFIATAVDSSILALEFCKPLVDIERSKTTVDIGTSSSLMECVDHCMLMAGWDEYHFQPDTSSDSTTSTFIYQGIPVPQAATDLSMVTLILIFNSALAHQMLAKHQEDDKDATGHASSSIKSLRKAKQLYQIAHAYLQAGMNVNLLFDFACINNIAVIDKKLGNDMVSEYCFCYLQARYLIMMHQKEYDRLRHLEGFYSRLFKS